MYITDWKISKNKLIDGYVILSLFLVPSSFLGLVSFRAFYIPGFFDLRLLSWILSLPLLFFYFKQIPKISSETSGRLLLLSVLYILFRFLVSIFEGLEFKEAFTVFRMGFNTPISCLGFLCFFYSVDNKRIEHILKWAFIFFIANMFFYLLNYIGFELYDNIKEINQETQHGITITRNLTGYPIYFPIFFVLSIFFMLNNWRFISVFIFLLTIFLVYISATRNFIVTNVLVLIFIFLFYLLKSNAGYIRNTLYSLIAVVFFVLLIFALKSDVYNFLKIKFFNTVDIELKENTGTYSYRKSLINQSIQEIKLSDDELFGKGYTRVGAKGNYKFVLGGDTLVAPILFCEGIAGLVIRSLPVLYFFFFSFRKRNINGIGSFIGIAILALIISSIINYVQTAIIYHFIEFLLFFYIAQLYLKNNETYPEPIQLSS